MDALRSLGSGSLRTSVSKPCLVWPFWAAIDKAWSVCCLPRLRVLGMCPTIPEPLMVTPETLVNSERAVIPVSDPCVPRPASADFVVCARRTWPPAMHLLPPRGLQRPSRTRPAPERKERGCRDETPARELAHGLRLSVCVMLLRSFMLTYVSQVLSSYPRITSRCECKSWLFCIFAHEDPPVVPMCSERA